MPLRPLSSVQSAQTNENRITPGRIVEYEQHSKPLLAVTLSERKGKWMVVNQSGGELELSVDRLTLLPGSAPDTANTLESKAAFLTKLSADALALEESLSLEEVWQVVSGEVKELSVVDVCEILFSKNTLLEHLATRRSLLNDQVFFKRKKAAFEPRPEHIVEELKIKVRIENEKRLRREKFIDAALERLKNPDATLEGKEVEQVAMLAALGKSAEQAKESLELVEAIIDKGRLSIGGRPEDKAFKLLVALRYFTPDQNLLPLRLGRPVEFSPEAITEAKRLAEINSINHEGRRDLRALPTVTIDGAETRDFDDALSLERTDGGYRIGVHISDVTELIAPGSILEEVGLRRATSIYCPDEHISMLPAAVSEAALSLIEGTERPVMSFFLETDESFNVISRDVCRAVIRIAQRITYEEADAVLYGELPEHPFRELLHGLWNAAEHSEGLRMEKGALQLNRRELTPHLNDEGTITLEESNEDKPGRRLVSEMMILANETAALFARENNLPLVFRSQEPPDVDIETACADIPEGPAREYFKRSMLKRSVVSYEAASHAGLGLSAYTQVTSPIRRVVDLINQRQIGSQLTDGRPMYDVEGIQTLLATVEQGLEEAQLIQRQRTRYWLLKYMVQEKLKEVGATIIRLDGPRPLAELDYLYSLQPFHPVEKIERNDPSNRRLIGKQIRLQIDSIDPRNDSLVLREIR